MEALKGPFVFSLFEVADLLFGRYGMTDRKVQAGKLQT
jgi:hypothetical protein